MKAKDNRYIFITGTSESGKSMIAEYIANEYNDSVHIKIRDVIKRMYEESDKRAKYEEWQEKFENTQKEQFWDLYLRVVDEMAMKSSLIVMDTLRKKESLEVLNKLTNGNIMLLYIDAKFEYRVKREYDRLSKEKNVSYEQVKLNTMKKDKEKEKMGLIEILQYIKNDNLKYGYVISNNGSLKNFKKCIDEKMRIFLGDNDVRNCKNKRIES